MSQTSQPRTRRPPTTQPVTPAAHDATLMDEMDALLDEIDDVLETNALEVTRAYRQRGGQ